MKVAVRAENEREAELVCTEQRTENRKRAATIERERTSVGGD
jgi:hypothetical protein